MKVQDLRIGNLLFGSDGEVAKVMRLDHENNQVWLNVPKCELATMRWGITPTPIPLTEEWLEKFGFGDFGHGRFELKDLAILDAHEGEWMLDVGGIEPYFKYVHQLQNLYYALCGEELTVK